MVLNSIFFIKLLFLLENITDNGHQNQLLRQVLYIRPVFILVFVFIDILIYSQSDMFIHACISKN